MKIVFTTILVMVFSLCCLTTQAALPANITINNQTKNTITTYAAQSCASPAIQPIESNTEVKLAINGPCQIALNNSKQWLSAGVIVITSSRTYINDTPKCKFNYQITVPGTTITFKNKN